jgi:hypothetical protein
MLQVLYSAYASNNLEFFVVDLMFSIFPVGLIAAVALPFVEPNSVGPLSDLLES